MTMETWKFGLNRHSHDTVHKEQLKLRLLLSMRVGQGVKPPALDASGSLPNHDDPSTTVAVFLVFLMSGLYIGPSSSALV